MIREHTTFARPAEALLALALGWLALIVTAGGIELSIGTLRLASQKVIVPGMLAWLLALVCGSVRGRLARHAPTDAADARAPVDERIALAGTLAVSVVLFVSAIWRGIGRPLTLDDHMMIAGAESFTPGALAGMLTGSGWSTPGFVRPLPELLWVLDVRVHGASPVWCHVENLALHALNALLVGLIARSLLGDAWRACLATALFAVCATHAEPLLWLSSRYDLTAATFGLGALAAFLAGRDALSLACTIAALLCKESALTIPLAVGALGVAHGRARAAAPHLIALAAFVAYRALFVHGLAHGSWATIPFDKVLQLPLAPLAPLGWPVNLKQAVELHPAARACIGLALALPPLLAVRQLALRPDRRILLAFALLVIVTVPVHHVISLPDTLRQSRYLYLPAALFAVLVAGLTRSLAPRRAVLAGALLVATHAALLRSNSEPFVAAGAVVARAVEASAPVVSALKAGQTVRLRGLPLKWRGADVCVGCTVIAPVTRMAGVPPGRLHLDGDAWRPVPPAFDRTFCWTVDGGFHEER